ncbi:MAG: cytochrome c oxidase subunit 3 family protein [Myxococcales bacterium]|nr:cytochrome c oxidase subunit 3 family protein [Myxococcales bacterium]MCB9583045.1 cytochrome c oxidase subunit 3 family protein [Polyangiaceae bacterium]
MTEASAEPVRGQKGQKPPPDVHVPEDEHDHEHGEYPFLAHHFDTPEHQFEAGKLGIWLFLVTEVLFFAGLFCAYTIYRAQRPEVFEYAHFFLDTTMGATNTVVLLVSSLTAAWAVRSAQLRNKTALTVNIVVTILCACTFMGIKYEEYAHKFHDGLLPGTHFHPAEPVWETARFKSKHPEAAEAAEHIVELQKEQAKAPAGDAKAAEGKAADAKKDEASADPRREEREYIASLRGEQLAPLVDTGMVNPVSHEATMKPPPHTATFFGIYFFMTGLHGLHVLIGIGIWIWLLFRARTGVFNEKYFGPIDYAALYWHLVDLIWIYLFPLLYLIH